MKAVIKNAGLPPGIYKCTFEGIDTMTHAEYGDGWKWSFAVIEGDEAGRTCSRVTKDKPTLKNSCGKFLAALGGKTPTDGLDVDSDDFLGCDYGVTVGPSPSGDSTRVESFLPLADCPF